MQGSQKSDSTRRGNALVFLAGAAVVLLGACRTSEDRTDTRTLPPSMETPIVPEDPEPEVVLAEAGTCTVRCCNDEVETIVADTKALCWDWCQGYCESRGHVNIIRWRGDVVFDSPHC